MFRIACIETEPAPPVSQVAPSQGRGSYDTSAIGRSPESPWPAGGAVALRPQVPSRCTGSTKSRLLHEHRTFQEALALAANSQSFPTSRGLSDSSRASVAGRYTADSDLLLPVKCTSAPLQGQSIKQRSAMTAQGFQKSEQDPSAPVLGIPVNQDNIKNSINSLPVISEGFCVPHDVVFVLQSNLNPRSTEIYNVIDSAGTPQFK